MADGLEAFRGEARSCRRCPLADSRSQVVLDNGDANATLMIVGEAPAKREDQEGRPFVGRAGKTLDGLLAGIYMTRPQVYVANVVMCRPPDNRPPRGDEKLKCAPYLDQQIALVRPRVILALGGTATDRLLGPGSLSGHLGTRAKLGQATVVPTYHPSGLNRAPERWPQIRSDFADARELIEGQWAVGHS